MNIKYYRLIAAQGKETVEASDSSESEEEVDLVLSGVKRKRISKKATPKKKSKNSN